MSPVRLLLVDDDESALSGLKVVLEAHDFEVTTALNVVEALRLITSETFDVLISDLHMPGPGDGMIVVGAMRQANPRAVTVLLSANPDMSRAATAILRQADEVFLKPPKLVPIVQAIRERLANGDMGERAPQFPVIEPITSILDRERSSIIQAWLARMMTESGLAGASLSVAERTEYLPDALNEILYRLRSPQALGLMTLFSMASLQHGARRRRQRLRSPVLVEEARALQVVLFQTLQDNLDRIDLGQLPAALMAIADEVNAQLLQSLSGYENEKPAPFTEED